MKTQSKTTGTMEESLERIFKTELTEVYYAQKQLVDVYKRLAEAAHSEDLKKIFVGQIQNAALQVGRIEQCFTLLELQPDTTYAEAVSGLAAAADKIINDFEEGPVRDTALISTAQKIEHYGISAYGTLRTMATVMGRVQCARLLEENKDEEVETDGALTRVAMNINKVAFEGA